MKILAAATYEWTMKPAAVGGLSQLLLSAATGLSCRSIVSMATE